MRKYFLATVSVLALNCGAQAADMPVKAPARPAVAPMSWTGWYVGVQGGVVGHEGEFLDGNGFLQGNEGAAAKTSTASDTGGIFGGHIGYNWQADRLLFGLEADISGVWAKASAAVPPPANIGSTISFDVDWLATIRARLGAVIADATLVYLTGGVAFGHVQNSATQAGFVTPSVMTNDETKTGWTIGGGIEHRLTRNWTVRAEGRYVDLGNTTVTCSPPASPNCGFTYRGELSNTLLMGLVGLSLRF